MPLRFPSCLDRARLFFPVAGQWTSGDQAGLLALARDHWQIKNRLFRVRDNTFAEDACRVRTSSAPQNLAHTRDAALTLIRRRKLSPKPAREAFAHNPKAAIRADIQS